MLVSIIIPYFNDPKNIKTSISSALKQTYSNIEIIVIDDENSNLSKKILKKCLRLSKKIKIISTKHNKGVGYARNLGVKNSKGELIAFLDSDDFWKKNKLKKQIKVMQEKKIDICYTDYKAFNENMKLCYKVKSPSKIDYKMLLKECPICCSSVILKRSVFNKHKFLSIKTKEDYELWLKLAKNNFTFGCVNEYLTFYKIRRNSLSSFHLNKILNAYQIYYYYNSFGLLSSLLFTLRLYCNAFIKKIN